MLTKTGAPLESMVATEQLPKHEILVARGEQQHSARAPRCLLCETPVRGTNTVVTAALYAAAATETRSETSLGVRVEGAIIQNTVSAAQHT